jgi:hypothetical protein
MRTKAVLEGVVALVISASGYAQDPDPGNHSATQNLTQSELLGMPLKDIRTVGLRVFSTPFNKQDGYGDGPFDPNEGDPLAFGHRPTLQGNGTFLRVNGLDAQSCNECHGFVSHATRPPELGIGGVGGPTTNAIIMPSLIDVADSSDDRVSHVFHEPDLPLVADGVADYNGRFSNPPFLFGGGGVELLAKEMTLDLQGALDDCTSNPNVQVNLQTDAGTDFGTVVCPDDETVDLSETVGIVPRPQDDVDQMTAVPLDEARALLVVRPFGRKGENFSMRDFDRGAMQFHFGIQPVEVVDPNGLGGVDTDGDQVPDEVTVPEMTALHIFDVTNPRPFMEDLDAEALAGFGTFQDIGCADCHVPELITESRFLPLAHPEVATDPNANVYLQIDLRKDVGKNQQEGFEPSGNGVVVPLFADLKRHRMGPRLAETFERGEIANDEFTTARLWGIGATEPYLHDGRATTLYAAIELHGGAAGDFRDGLFPPSEAQDARDAFLGLLESEQGDLIHFLGQLRTPEDPNSDIVKTLAAQ